VQITFIVSLVVSLVTFGAMVYFHRKADRSQYSFITSAPKLIKKIVAGFFIFAMVMMILAIVLSFFDVEAIIPWMSFGFGAFNGLLSLICFFDIFFNFEGLQGNSLVVNRFFIRKTVRIDEIRKISLVGLYIVFSGKNDRILFRIDVNTKNLQELITQINARSTYPILGIDLWLDPTIFQKNGAILGFKAKTSPNDEALYQALGKDYRQGFPKRKRQFITISVITCLLCVAASVGLALIDHNLVFVIFVPLCVIVMALFCSATLKNFAKELEMTDYELGIKHCRENPQVKGNAKNKFVVARITSIVGIVFGTLFSAMYFLVDKTPLLYEDLEIVNGSLEYRLEHYGKDEYLAIAFQGHDVEYRLNSMNLDELDTSFFDDIAIGDTLTIYIVPDSVNEWNPSDERKSSWTYFYYLASPTKEYLNYEDYLRGFNKNLAWGNGMAITGGAIALFSAGALITSYLVFKKRREKETIDV